MKSLRFILAVILITVLTGSSALADASTESEAEESACGNSTIVHSLLDLEVGMLAVQEEKDDPADQNVTEGKHDLSRGFRQEV